MAKKAKEQSFQCDECRGVFEGEPNPLLSMDLTNERAGSAIDPTYRPKYKLKAVVSVGGLTATIPIHSYDRDLALCERCLIEFVGKVWM